MSINDIADAIEYQEVWASWHTASIDNLDAKRARDAKMAELRKGMQ